jgi:electron transfer flavoprotein alpha subunit
MPDILVLAETRGGAVRKVAFEAVSAARAAVDHGVGGEVHVLVAGGPGIGQAAAETLGRYGADLVLAVEDSGLANGNPEVVVRTVAARARNRPYRLILGSASAQGRDLAPRVAAALGMPLAADVVGFEPTGDAVIARHPVYTGKAIATLRLTGAPAVLTLRPGALSPAENVREPRVESLAPAIDPAAARVQVTAVESKGAAKLDLADAPVVISGGRGLKAAENFKLVEDLAAAFDNAAVGATRAVTDDGWRDPADQIGQTGRVVAPGLYIAVGISGAIQHLAGMRASKVIVAINRDKDAPIFKVADYGIVGDLFEVVPRLTEEIRKARSDH